MTTLGEVRHAADELEHADPMHSADARAERDALVRRCWAEGNVTEADLANAIRRAPSTVRRIVRGR
jgi:hypothetical protein